MIRSWYYLLFLPLLLFLASACTDDELFEEKESSVCCMIPDEYYVLAGQSADLYFNECIQGEDRGTDNTLMHYTYGLESSHSGITIDDEAIRIWVAEDKPGDYEVSLLIYEYDDNPILRKTFTIKAISPVLPDRERTILMLGDSWTSINNEYTGEGYVYFLNNWLGNDAGQSFHFVGSRQISNNELWHEGRGGYTYRNWLESNNNPLYNTERKKVDFSYYRTEVLGIESGFDVVNIQLGVNDCIRKKKSSSDDITTSVNSCFSLIEAILADSPDCKIIVNPPGMDMADYNSWIQLYGDEFKKEDYQYNRWELYVMLYGQIKASEHYGKSLFWGQSILGLNRWANYTNATHPNVDGYREMAYSLAPQLLHILRSAE